MALLIKKEEKKEGGRGRLVVNRKELRIKLIANAFHTYAAAECPPGCTPGVTRHNISRHGKNVTHKIACMLDLYQHLSNKTMSVTKSNVGDLGAKCASRSELRI